MEVKSIFEALPVKQFDLVFTEKHYPDSYEKYLQDNLELRQMLAKRNFEQADFEAGILKEVEKAKASVKAEKFFNRKSYQFAMTQAVCVYALPMLLALEDEESHPLTSVLIAKWKLVFGDNLQAAAHETIAKSFNPSFMGFANPFKQI